MNERASALGRTYSRAYAALCGAHPVVYPWHFQWLASNSIMRAIGRAAKPLAGRVIDIGCGGKPYRALFAGATEYVGADLECVPNVDVVIHPDQSWPVPDGAFDVLLCTQAIQHIADLDLFVSEVSRVLRAGGVLIVSGPFIYNQHGIISDFWRFSAEGLQHLFHNSFDTVRIEKLGGAGTAAGMLTLNWLDNAMNRNRATRVLHGLLMPLWIVWCGLTNCLAVLIDAIDKTGCFYQNVMLVAERR